MLLLKGTLAHSRQETTNNNSVTWASKKNISVISEFLMENQQGEIGPFDQDRVNGISSRERVD